MDALGVAKMDANTRRKSAWWAYWQLIDAGEPFRLLFPVGTALAVAGVGLWPLFFWQVIEFYPGVAHARIMIEGFFGAFIMGFLSTALPRLLEMPRWTGWESLLTASFLGGAVVLHAQQRHFWADICFLTALMGFLLGVCFRWLLRADQPPPGFVLVGAGLLSALLGSVGLILFQISTLNVPEWGPLLCKLLLYQGFLIFPVMGVGGFLLPRFFSSGSRAGSDVLILPAFHGWHPVLWAGGCGTIVLAGFFVEVQGVTAWGNAIKGVGVLLYLLPTVPFYQRNHAGSLAGGVRIALMALVLGYLLIAWDPSRRLSFLHVVYIGGFSLLTIVVASRVILGHSGQSEKFTRVLPALRWCGIFFFAAMVTRVAADWMPATQMAHYAYAALIWIVGVLLWAVYILPGVRKADAA